MKTTGRKPESVVSGGGAGITSQAGGLLLIKALRATVQGPGGRRHRVRLYGPRP